MVPGPHNKTNRKINRKHINNNHTMDNIFLGGGAAEHFDVRKTPHPAKYSLSFLYIVCNYHQWWNPPLKLSHMITQGPRTISEKLIK